MKRLRWIGSVALAATALLVGFRRLGQAPSGAAFAQEAPGLGAQNAHLKPVRVRLEAHHDVSPALRDVPALRAPAGALRAMPRPVAPHPRISRQADPVAQSSAGPLVSASAGLKSLVQGLNFDGVGANGWVPSDANGAVGATQFVQWVNIEFAVYNKTTGALEYGPAAGNALWAGFGGPCEGNNNGDPIAQYDKAAGRWVMAQAAFTDPYFYCVAVSTTSDATGSYNRYAFGVDSFPDYAKLGVWPDAYYVSFNAFGPVTYGAEACALDRTQMLAGNAATAQCFVPGAWSLLPADLDGTIPPPAGSPNYFLNLNTNSLDLWKFHVDWATPGNSTFTGPTNIPVAPFNYGFWDIPQLGTTQPLESLGDRLMYRLAYRNFGHHESLVVNHNVIDSTNGYTRVAERWYELRSPGSNPTVYQQGTYAPDFNSRWMGSIAMDKVGNIALGYSVSGDSMCPAIRYASRAPRDPLGTLGAETSIIEGAGSQQADRWGDYTSMSVDPSDDCTFWYTNQYLQSDGWNWSTRIASFKFPSCKGHGRP